MEIANRIRDKRQEELKWTLNFGSSAILVKVPENRHGQSRRRRMMAIRRTGSMPNFA